MTCNATVDDARSIECLLNNNVIKYGKKTSCYNSYKNRKMMLAA